MVIVDEYLGYVKECTKKYGYRTLVFLQCGSFYEIYDMVTPDKSPHMRVCAEVLNICITRKDKSKANSPYMAGIPVDGIQKHIRLLLANNYTVVMYDQKKSAGGKYVREQTRALSPGCCLSEDVYESTHCGESVFMVVLVDEIRPGVSAAYQCTFDSNSGKIMMGTVARHTSSDSNTLSSTPDTLSCLSDELGTQPFNELVICHRSKKLATSGASVSSTPTLTEQVDAFANRCRLEHVLVHTLDVGAGAYSHVFTETFQREFLERVYSHRVALGQTIFESIGIPHLELAYVGCLVLTLDMVQRHDKLLVSKLEKPIHSGFCTSPCASGSEAGTENDTCPIPLTHYNDLFKKMDIFPATERKMKLPSLGPSGSSGNNSSSSGATSGHVSLFDCLNRTKTKMGAELLRERMQHLSTSIPELESRYNLVAAFLTEENEASGLYKTCHNNLRCIDLNRIYRRFLLGKLSPIEIPRIKLSQEEIVLLMKALKKLPKNHVMREKLPGLFALCEPLIRYQNRMNSIFDDSACVGMTLSGLNRSIFVEGKYTKIDAAVKNWKCMASAVEELAALLMDLVPAHRWKSAAMRKQTSANWILIKGAERDGHRLELTSSRYKVLNTLINEMDESAKAEFQAKSNGRWGVDELEFDTRGKTTVKISSPAIREHSQRVSKAHSIMMNLVLKKYGEVLRDLHESSYNQLIKPMCEMIAELDVAYSTATNVLDMGLCRPRLHESMDSFSPKDQYETRKPSGQLDNMDNMDDIPCDGGLAAQLHTQNAVVGGRMDSFFLCQSLATSLD